MVLEFPSRTGVCTHRIKSLFSLFTYTTFSSLPPPSISLSLSLSFSFSLYIFLFLSLYSLNFHYRPIFRLSARIQWLQSINHCLAASTERNLYLIFHAMSLCIQTEPDTKSDPGWEEDARRNRKIKIGQRAKMVSDWSWVKVLFHIPSTKAISRMEYICVCVCMRVNVCVVGKNKIYSVWTISSLFLFSLLMIY